MIDLADSGCTNAEDNSENTPPVITLNGLASLIITLGNIYNELGALANDIEDGANLAVTNITGTVNTAVAGLYVISYNFTDLGGATAPEVTRTVTVANVCADGVDNDEDTFVDLADPGCADANDTNETDPIVPPAVENTAGLCSDTVDNDSDTLTDLADPDCAAFGRRIHFQPIPLPISAQRIGRD